MTNSTDFGRGRPIYCSLDRYIWTIIWYSGVTEYRHERVCMSVREHISGTTRPTFTKLFFVHDTHSRGSVILWLRCDTSCTSGSMKDVIFAHNWRYGGMSISLRRVTSLLDNTPAAPCWLRQRWAPRLDESIVQGVSGAEPAVQHCLVV